MSCGSLLVMGILPAAPQKLSPGWGLEATAVPIKVGWCESKALSLALSPQWKPSRRYWTACVFPVQQEREERGILFLKMASGHTFQPDLVKRIREAIRRPVCPACAQPHSGDTGHPGRPPSASCFWSSQLDACSCFIYSCFMLPGNPIPILFFFSAILLSFLTPKLHVRQLVLNTGFQR